MSTEPTEAERKTLDDIRRELDAQYGYIDISEPALNTGDAAPDRARDVERAGPPIAERLSKRGDAEEARVAPPLADFREIADRHQLVMGRRNQVGAGAARRSGYLIAALVGCVVGQALLFAFLAVTRYDARPEVSRARVVSPGSEIATAAAPISAAPPESPFSPETRSEADESAAVASSPSSSIIASPQPSVDLPPRGAEEMRASSSREAAMVSTATVRGNVAPRVTQEPRPAAARLPGVGGVKDVAESQARLRVALTEWLRTSAGGGAPVQSTEPVIVLGRDGRTAKTYVSIMSPIGLIPREQRWELGPRGWGLVEDRQAGLPIPGTATTLRER